MDKEVKDDINRKAEETEPLPDLITNAYYLLGQDWLETRNSWLARGHNVPPVMITVANRTETSSRIKFAFDHKQILIPELCDSEKTLQIDSRVLDEAEAAEESIVIDENGKKLTKKQQAELLRRQVDTVGRFGQPGGQIQKVISVGMLSEGWDASTVTHIMGLRAFSSQLLCEQVVGRGLRRTSYDVGDDGLFAPEYVNIFGVPFTFLPHEGGEGPPPPPPPPKTVIEPVQEKEAHELTWPNILRVDHVYWSTLVVDMDVLDKHRNVKSWVKNDHLGFVVLYNFQGVVRKYYPDFIINLGNGEHLILETKGKDSQQNKTKRAFLDEWVKAVNNQGGFGKWQWAVSFHPSDLAGILNDSIK